MTSIMVKISGSQTMLRDTIRQSYSSYVLRHTGAVLLKLCPVTYSASQTIGEKSAPDTQNNDFLNKKWNFQYFKQRHQ
jgi:hypothetical protein